MQDCFTETEALHLFKVTQRHSTLVSVMKFPQPILSHVVCMYVNFACMRTMKPGSIFSFHTWHGHHVLFMCTSQWEHNMCHTQGHMLCLIVRRALKLKHDPNLHDVFRKHSEKKVCVLLRWESICTLFHGILHMWSTCLWGLDNQQLQMVDRCAYTQNSYAEVT